MSEEDVHVLSRRRANKNKIIQQRACYQCNRCVSNQEPGPPVIPAKGYRYVPSEASYLEELKSSGKIPGNERGTYISFNNFDDAKIATDRLQVPHDASYKVEFDTKQVLEDLKIPNGDWSNPKKYLEPLTRDNPQFGAGGATQAVTKIQIQARKITDLRTGKGKL